MLEAQLDFLLAVAEKRHRLLLVVPHRGVPGNQRDAVSGPEAEGRLQLRDMRRERHQPEDFPSPIGFPKLDRVFDEMIGDAQCEERTGPRRLEIKEMIEALRVREASV